MKIKVNGEEKKIELRYKNPLLSKTLESMGYKSNTIVVELNNLIVNSKKWVIVSSLKLKNYEDFLYIKNLSFNHPQLLKRFLNYLLL